MITSCWWNQPIWKISCLSNWIISQCVKTYLSCHLLQETQSTPSHRPESQSKSSWISKSLEEIRGARSWILKTYPSPWLPLNLWWTPRVGSELHDDFFVHLLDCTYISLTSSFCFQCSLESLPSSMYLFSYRTDDCRLLSGLLAWRSLYSQQPDQTEQPRRAKCPTPLQDGSLPVLNGVMTPMAVGL